MCLTQSISARKATHIKLGTCLGSSQCQLHFGTKMVSTGWMAVRGCLLNAKIHIFWHFLRLPPLALINGKPTTQTTSYIHTYICRGSDNLGLLARRLCWPSEGNALLMTGVALLARRSASHFRRELSHWCRKRCLQRGPALSATLTVEVKGCITRGQLHSRAYKAELKRSHC